MTELDWEKNKSSHSVTLRGRTALAIIVGSHLSSSQRTEQRGRRR